MGLFRSGPTVSVLRLAGIIGRPGPLRGSLQMHGMAPLIDRAFRGRALKAVALAINSPGGSAVQSALIHSRIRALAEEKNVPVLTFAEDVAASGGYWLACAGDEIYADENSIIGSIGVVSAGFGFTGLIDRIGVDRRLHAAGKDKALLDPFTPEKPEDVAKLKAIQGDIHDSFKDLVRSRRGKRLKASEDELFNGAVWTGKRALDLGLVDGLGDLRSVLRDRFGEKVRMRVITPPRGWLRRRAGISVALPSDWGAELLAAVEDRVMWNRFGL